MIIFIKEFHKLTLEISRFKTKRILLSILLKLSSAASIASIIKSKEKKQKI